MKNGNATEMKQRMAESSITNLGVHLKLVKQPITQEEFAMHRFGKYR